MRLSNPLHGSLFARVALILLFPGLVLALT